jgi:hypothetical protein
MLKVKQEAENPDAKTIMRYLSDIPHLIPYSGEQNVWQCPSALHYLIKTIPLVTKCIIMVVVVGRPDFIQIGNNGGFF